MDVFATLSCCLLALSFAKAQTERGNLGFAGTSTITTPGLNVTHTATTAPSSNSSVAATVLSSLTEDTTPFNGVSPNNETATEATTVTTEIKQTHQSTTITTSLTNNQSVATTTPTMATALTTAANQTTESYSTTPSASIKSTNSSAVANTTSDLTHRTTRGLGLNISEKYMTIVFSVVLGVFALALLVLKFHRCKQRIQFLHQPLNNTSDMDAFVADEDTLVISGGLYDGGQVFDNAPPAPADQSHVRLEFLH